MCWGNITVQPAAIGTKASRSPFEGAPHQVEDMIRGQHQAKECLQDWPKVNLHSGVSFPPIIFSQVEVLPESQFPQVHPMLKALFSGEIHQVALAGRTRFFLKNWKKLTSDVVILECVKGYQIPFLCTPTQAGSQIPPVHMNKEMSDLAQEEV